MSEASNPSIPALALGDEGMVPPLEASPTMTDIAALDEKMLTVGGTSRQPFESQADPGLDQTVLDMRLQADAATLPETTEPEEGEGAFQAFGEAPDELAAEAQNEAPAESSAVTTQTGPPLESEASSAPPAEQRSEPPAEELSTPPAEAGEPNSGESGAPVSSPDENSPAEEDGAAVGPSQEAMGGGELASGDDSSLPPEEPEESLLGDGDGDRDNGSDSIEAEAVQQQVQAAQIRGDDDEIKVSAQEVSAEREAKKVAAATKNKGRIFSEGGTGLLLVFLTGITLGGAGILTVKEMELNEIQAERERERRVQDQWKPILDAARKQDEEKKLRTTRLRVKTSTRPLDVRTAQQVGKVGFSGLNQAVVAGKDGTRYRVYWGRLVNGRPTQIDAVRVLLEWVAPMKRGGGVQLEDRRGQANSLAFGHCPSENLKCLDRRPVVEVGDLVSVANIQAAKAMVLSRMDQPGVSTIVLPGGSVPFLLYEVADDGRQIDDSWLAVQLIEEAMPDRRYGRTKARQGKGKRRRRMRSRRRRQGP